MQLSIEPKIRVIVREKRVLLEKALAFELEVSDAEIEPYRKSCLAYLNGDLLLPFPLEATLSAFSKELFLHLSRIPFGQTRSYGELAQMMGKRGAARAVGQTLHHNPLPLIIPCHRIIRGDGEIGGYAFGDAVKRELLRFEANRCC